MTRRTKQRSIVAIALCALIFLIAVPCGFAQFSSGFTGIVLDQTGAVVVGAKVTATNEDTHVSNVAISNESGNFRIPSLPGGVYTVEVSAPAFKSWKDTGIKLEQNETKTIRPSLALPTQSESVEVSAAIADRQERYVARNCATDHRNGSSDRQKRLYEHDSACSRYNRIRSSQRGRCRLRFGH